MKDTTLMGMAVCAIGLFSLLGAALDWDFFMNHRKAARLASLIGRKGARRFYGALGTVLILAGIGFATGLLSNHRSSGPGEGDAVAGEAEP